MPFFAEGFDYIIIDASVVLNFIGEIYPPKAYMYSCAYVHFICKYIFTQIGKNN